MLLPTPPAGPPPAQPVLIGPALAADALANTPLGPHGIQVSCRFRANPGGRFIGVRPFLIWSFRKAGYHAGTGGTLAVTLETDDGSPAHAPSGKVLARHRRALSLTPVSDGFYPLLAFDRSPVLQAGVLYHIVFRNPHPDPNRHFVSLNAAFQLRAGAPAQPGLSDLDWALLWRTGADPAWRPRRTPGSAEAFTPIMEVYCQAGGGQAPRAQGVGYVEFWMGAPAPLSGPDRVRQGLTGGPRPLRVTAVVARLRHLAGPGRPTARLEGLGPGLDLEAAGPLPEPSPSGALGGAAWVRFPLPAPRILPARAPCRVILGAPPGTRYEAFPMRKGTDKGYTAASVHTGGHAERGDGTGWHGWTQWGRPGRTDADLPIYLEAQEQGGEGEKMN